VQESSHWLLLALLLLLLLLVLKLLFLLSEPPSQRVSANLLLLLLLLLLQEVQRPLLAAKIEAASARKGVGLVKVRCRQRCCLCLRLCFATSTWVGILLAALVLAAECALSTSNCLLLPPVCNCVLC
jgi:hypothetical protein